MERYIVKITFPNLQIKILEFFEKPDKNYCFILKNKCTNINYDFFFERVAKVGHKCQFLSHVQLFATPQTVKPTNLWPWDSPGKNTGVGCHSLLQGASQPKDRTLVSCIADTLYSLSHQGSPKGGRSCTVINMHYRATGFPSGSVVKKKKKSACQCRSEMKRHSVLSNSLRPHGLYSP